MEDWAVKYRLFVTFLLMVGAIVGSYVVLNHVHPEPRVVGCPYQQ
jgi:hypothetical protein